MKIYITLFSYLLIIILNSTSFAEKDTLSIKNEFVKAVVNNKDAVGRFALETTLGNPENKKDDFQDLIYGKPIPWTSYSTILIDDTPFIFGNPDKKLERWANKSFTYIPISEQYVSDNSIISKGYINDILISQTLSFYKNPNTNLHDSLLINYAINNQSDVTKSIGLRILLDTKLGKNDGAPLRSGYFSITDELQIKKENLLNYWQAFDNLTSPNIIAQGIFNDSENLLTIPDYIHLANWGSLAETPWSSTYVEGRSFVRLGEDQKDTSLAMYYNKTNLEQNTSRSIKTVYGLGGISISAGDLSLGLSAPKKRLSTQDQPFLIMAYLYNSSGYDTYDLNTEFILSPELEIAKGEQTKSISILKKDQQLQIPLLVKLKPYATNNPSISFKATSSTLSSNKITHNIKLLAPSIQLRSEKEILLNENAPYIILTSFIKNTSELPLNDISIAINNINKQALAPFETKSKKIISIPPYNTIPVKWVVNSNNLNNLDTLNMKQTLKAPGIKSTELTTNIIPKKTPSKKLELYSQSKQITPIFLTIKINSSLLENNQYTLQYNTKQLNLISYNTSDLSALNITPSETGSLMTIDSQVKFIYLHFQRKDKSAIRLELKDNNANIIENLKLPEYNYSKLETKETTHE